MSGYPRRGRAHMGRNASFVLGFAVSFRFLIIFFFGGGENRNEYRETSIERSK